MPDPAAPSFHAQLSEAEEHLACARFSDAMDVLQRALNVLDPVEPGDALPRGEVHLLLGRAHLAQGKPQDAVVHFTVAVAELRAACGETSAELMVAARTLAETLADIGSHAEAEVLARSALRAAQVRKRPARDFISILAVLGRALAAQGQRADAEKFLRHALERAEQIGDRTESSAVRRDLVRVLRAQNRHAEAEAVLERARLA